ncbi:hypothetical protein ACFYY3_15210 [Streptomyces sp. NPDC001812]|uniref:hypothetical protein n=1 Tax=Streptomyces sp. NPDC001812 TaxID=3364611 RepID=UPI00367B508B
MIFVGTDLVHAAFGEVAAGEGGPFVVHLDEDGGGEAFESVGVGENLDDVDHERVRLGVSVPRAGRVGGRSAGGLVGRPVARC